MKRRAHIPTSEVLQELIDDAPADHLTLDWLLDNLHSRSFGIIMLILALFAMAPGASGLVAPILAVPAIQMVAGRSRPLFPRRIAIRPLSKQRFVGAVRRAVPVLQYLETVIHPRWPTPFGLTKR